MTICQPAAKPRKDGSVKMERTVYLVEKLDPAPDVASLAYRLTKLSDPDGEHYDVALFPFGATCECQSWNADYQNHASSCKHVLALMAAGLIPKVQP